MFQIIEEYLLQEYYGNTLWRWSASVFLVIFSLIIGRTFYWFFTKVIKRWSKNTATKLDDILIDMCEEPVVFGGTTICIWYSISILNLSENLESFVSKLFFIAFVFNIAWLLTRTFEALVQQYLVPITQRTETDLDDLLLPLVRKGSKIGIWGLAIIIGLNNAGYNVITILAGLGIGGIGVAMAAKEVLGNLIGGLMIMFSRPFKIGDRIRIKKYDGKVKSIGLFTTIIIHTDTFNPVTLPNLIFNHEILMNVTQGYEGSWEFITTTLFLSVDSTPEQVDHVVEKIKSIILQSDNTEFYFALLDNNNNYSLGVKYSYAIRNVKGVNRFQLQHQISCTILKDLNNNNIKLAS